MYYLIFMFKSNYINTLYHARLQNESDKRQKKMKNDDTH